MIKAFVVLILSTCLLQVIPHSACAKEFGKRAVSFEILEEDLIQMIKRKLGELDMEKEKKKMIKIATDRVENPPAVQGIIRAEENREFWYDPTYVLKEDAVLPCGKIMHKAGTTVNPLDHMDLNRRLFFIDSRDAAQVEWLKENLHVFMKDQMPIIQDRIILVAGSPGKFKKELNGEPNPRAAHKHEVYFDQTGELTTKFGIKAVPAVMEQDGRFMKINEILLEESYE